MVVLSNMSEEFVKIKYSVYWQFNDMLIPVGVPVSYQSSNNSVTLVFTPTASSPIQPGKYQCIAELAVSADAPNPKWKVMSDPVLLIPIGSSESAFFYYLN